MKTPIDAIALRASLIGLVAFAILSPAARTAPLHGRVVDAETGEPVAAAEVRIRGEAATTTSAEDGTFALDGAPDQPFTLLVTYPGYEPVLQPVDPAVPGDELAIALIPSISASEEIVITASRYRSDVHLSHTNLSRHELVERIATDDVPMLLADTPGLHAYSDAGNGVGYTYLNIRGFDQKRVGVMINGIPLNDPEDHQVYWVDVPDLISSVEDVQVQRGITNSLGATTAIGGTVNLVTDLLTVDSSGQASLWGGSYDTRKESISYNTGLFGGRFLTALRYSRIESDGYRERSGSELWGGFWSGRLITARTTTQANVYTGHEVSHHAWDAVDDQTLATNRRFNPETYENAIDDFRQPHYELHHEWQISDRLTFRNSAYYIHGEGFYENEKFGRDVVEFSLDVSLGLDPNDFPDGEVDLIRRKNVEKDQYGWVSHLTLYHTGGRTIVGGDVYTFHSDHWGNVLSVNGERLDRWVDYYHYDGDKVAWSVFVNERVEIAPGLTLLVDLQHQHKEYEFQHEELGNFTGEDRHAYEVEYDFFNPKGGVYWRLPGQPFGGEMGLYAHVGVTHREPTDSELFDTWYGPDDLGVAPLFATSQAIDEDGDGLTDYLRWSDPYVEEEEAIDYEIGASWRGKRLSLTANGYWMDFRNEIVPFGAVDDDGLAIKGNAEKTLHRGIELGLTARLGRRHDLLLAASRSWDEFDRFIVYEDQWDWDTWEYLGTVAYDYGGNPIALFPDHLVSLILRSRFGPVATNVRVRRVGHQHLDNSGLEERTIDAYTTVDLGLTLELGRLGPRWLHGMRLDVRVRNLLDEEYESYGYYDPWAGGNMKIPAATRNVLAGVRISF